MRIHNSLMFVLCASLNFFQLASASQPKQQSVAATLMHTMGQQHIEVVNAFNEFQADEKANGEFDLNHQTSNPNLGHLLPKDQQEKVKDAIFKGNNQGLEIAAAQQIIRAAERNRPLSEKKEEIAEQARLQAYAELAAQKAQLGSKDKAFEHARYMGALSAAATVAGKQYLSEHKSFGSTVTDAAHKGIDMAVSAVVNAAIAGGITYGAEYLYNYFFTTPEKKKEIPAELVKAMTQKKQQELIHKEKNMNNNDIMALKAQSEILAEQCKYATTPALKSLCDAMRAEILKQNLMALAKRAQLDGNFEEESEEPEQKIDTKPEEKDGKNATATQNISSNKSA